MSASSTTKAKKRGILSLPKVVRDLLPESVSNPAPLDDDPTDQVPALNREDMGKAPASSVPSATVDEDPVARLAESTGVPLTEAPKEDRQAAARRLESELHQRLARWIKLEDELRRQTVEMSRVSSALDNSQASVTTLEATVQNLTVERDEALRKIESLEAKIAADYSSVTAIADNHAALEMEAGHLRLLLDERTAQLAQESARLADASRELQSHQDALLGLETTLKSQKAVVEKHDKEKAALASAIGDLEAALKNSQSQHRSDESVRQNLAAEMHKVESALAAQRTAADKERSRLEQAVAQLEESAADRDNRLHGLQSEVTGLKAREQELLARLADNDGELERRLGRVESLEKVGSSLTMERDQQRATIDALNAELRTQRKVLDVLKEGVPNMDDIVATVSTLDEWVSSQMAPDPAPVANATSRPVLEEINGSSVTRHPLDKGVFTIGRSVECDLRVGGAYTSRQHARIVNSGGPTTIEDVGSANGIIVNHVQVARCVLHDGDIVEIGSTRFRFVDLPPMQLN